MDATLRVTAAPVKEGGGGLSVVGLLLGPVGKEPLGAGEDGGGEPPAPADTNVKFAQFNLVVFLL